MQDPSYVLIPLRRRDGSIRAHAVVDAVDMPLAEHRWHLNPNGYAARHGGRTQTVYLHREIMGLTPGDGLEVDHRDRDRLNCRRANMRIVETLHNHQNLAARPHSSRFRGVIWVKGRGRWRATATINGRTHFIGYFADEPEAGHAARAFRLAHMPGALD